MKKLIFISIASIGINFYLSAQSVGDYRSIGSGNWNDPTKWEAYNGSSWGTTISFPGEQPGTGLVTISPQTEIKITETVPSPVSAVFNTTIIVEGFPAGVLLFSSENAVSLSVTGDMTINGSLAIENRNGAKLHSLFIGGNLEVGFYWDEFQANAVGWFQSANGDDRLHVTFNSNDPVTVSGVEGITLHDVTFNCAGIAASYITVNGTATFISGIVSGGIQFNDGSSVSGASPVSFVDGSVSKVGNGPFTFPIGDDNIYSPLTISAPPYPIIVYYAQYVRANAEALGPIQDPGLYSVSNCEYWVFRSSGTSPGPPINVTVGWTGASGCGSSPYISNVSDVTLALNTYSWSSHGGSGTGTTSNGSVTWNGLNQLGILTFGNLKPGCVAPYENYALAVTPSSATLTWNMMSGAINYDVDYKVQGTTNWINAATATPSNILTISNLGTANYDWRVRSNCSSLSSAYVQSSFTIASTNPLPPVCYDAYEINNTSRQARTITVGNAISAGIASTYDIDWFKITTPNNSNTNLEVTLSYLLADYDLYVYNKSSKLVGSSINFGTSNEVVIYNSNARNATYYIKVIGKNGAFNAAYCYSLVTQVSSSSAQSVSSASIPQKEIHEGLNKQMVYPNPASEFVYLNFNSVTEGSVNIQIVNSIGQLVKQHPVNTIKGLNQFKIQVADIRPGMYILRINKGDLNLTRKFVIAR